MRRMSVTAAAIAASVLFAGGAGPAAAAAGPGPAETTATGWVVENPRADGLFDTFEGSATIGLADGATISCPLVDGSLISPRRVACDDATVRHSARGSSISAVRGQRVAVMV